MAIDLDGLNAAQREAVECTEGPLLVLAGAGSGKTRVLTYRIANLVENKGVAPWQILAITFTNKAAAEMRERLGGLIGPRCRGMWVSTFHSMCVRMLRADAERLGFSPAFTIYDTDDQKRLYREIMAELDLNPKVFQINAVMGRISQAKNELLTPAQFAEKAKDPLGKAAARVYGKLQERLKAANAFDFDDLLMYAYLLLKHHPDVLEAYQERFRYLLVDEYQDTNRAQYAITQLLAAKYGNIMVVGDDDQSIYSWRGADLRNILDFEQDYPRAHTVKLEENYRSVGNVLAAANAVIANNRQRKQKKLVATREDGEKLQVYAASDERDEGRWIAGEIEKLTGEGFSYDDMAVFYRTNAQSRMLEDMLLRAGVPYRIVGGTRFFERAEIRNVMAYLTLAVNPSDDMAATRVVNVPKRGVGKTTIERIQQMASQWNMTFLQAAEQLVADPEVRASTRNAIASFLQLVKEARDYQGDLRRVVETIVDKSGLLEELRAQGTDEARGRIENIQEFMGVVDEFTDTHTVEDAEFAAPTAADVAAEGAEQGAAAPVRVLRGDSLADFIEWVRLRTDLDAVSEDESAVTLMTVHASKGLEFDCVFVAGMEETIFPHLTFNSDPSAVEEERRLAYVAITRARKKLYLTCANTRQLYGQTSSNPVSRFIREIPPELRQTTGLGSAGFEGTGWEKRGSRRGISGSGSEAGCGRVFDRSSNAFTAGRGDTRRSGAGAGAGKRGGSFASFMEEESGRVFGSSGRNGSSSGSGFGGRAGSKAAARTRPQPPKQTAAVYAAGDKVDHKTFGRGTVVKVDGDTLHVRFEKSGQTKKLLRDYAPIVKIG